MIRDNLDTAPVDRCVSGMPGSQVTSSTTVMSRETVEIRVWPSGVEIPVTSMATTILNDRTSDEDQATDGSQVHPRGARAWGLDIAGSHREEIGHGGRLPQALRDLGGPASKEPSLRVLDRQRIELHA